MVVDEKKEGGGDEEELPGGGQGNGIIFKVAVHSVQNSQTPMATITSNDGEQHKQPRV